MTLPPFENDAGTMRSAERFAKIIADYWMQRGFHVEVAIDADGSWWVPRSDLINGMPRGVRPR